MRSKGIVAVEVFKSIVWFASLLLLSTSTLVAVVFLPFTNLPLASAVDQPNLPFGDINVVALTDVHSWIGGHGEKEPNLNADYGDVLSFYELLKQYCDYAGKELFFVVNGDWIDGTGLAMNGDPSHLVPLLEKMPFDALNVGNHELYRKDVIEYVTRPGGFVKWWGDGYLSSNVVLAQSMEPIGSRYKVLRGKQYSLLVFGFLYDMEDNDPIVKVEKVEKDVETAWFSTALHEESFDAILVLAHMDVKHPLLNVILSKIRSELGENIPVQFITGHTHIRGYELIDGLSASFEPGHYLDTVGFASFPTKATVAAAPTSTDIITAPLGPVIINHNMPIGSNNSNVTVPMSTNLPLSQLFKHVHLDANVDKLRETLGVPTLATAKGKALSTFIAKTQERMGLEEIISCMSRSYFLNRSVEAEDSLWGYFRDFVVPSQFKEYRNPVAVLLERGSWRYDLLEGNVHVNDVLEIASFNTSLWALEGIPWSAISELNNTMNKNRTDSAGLVKYILSPVHRGDEGPRVDDIPHDLIFESFDDASIRKELTKIYPGAAKLTPISINRATTDIWIQHFRTKRMVCPNQRGKGWVNIPSASDVLDLNSHHGLWKGMGALAAIVFLAMACYFCARLSARRRRAPKRDAFSAISGQHGGGYTDDIDERENELDEYEDELL